MPQLAGGRHVALSASPYLGGLAAERIESTYFAVVALRLHAATTQSLRDHLVIGCFLKGRGYRPVRAIRDRSGTGAWAARRRTRVRPMRDRSGTDCMAMVRRRIRLVLSGTDSGTGVSVRRAAIRDRSGTGAWAARRRTRAHPMRDRSGTDYRALVRRRIRLVLSGTDPVLAHGRCTGAPGSAYQGQIPERKSAFDGLAIRDRSGWCCMVFVPFHGFAQGNPHGTCPFSPALVLIGAVWACCWAEVGSASHGRPACMVFVPFRGFTQGKSAWIAVGPPVTRRPPHRSGRA